MSKPCIGEKGKSSTWRKNTIIITRVLMVDFMKADGSSNPKFGTSHNFLFSGKHYAWAIGILSKTGQK